MNLVGDKVVLRAIEEGDRDLLLELINDPETEKMLGGSSFPVSTIEQEQWIRKQAENKSVLRCVITEKGFVSKGLGTVILSDIDYKNGSAQVHIKISKDGRHKGLGTESLNTIVNYAFDELRLNCVYSEVLIYNIVSQRLFEKCGFKKDGVLRSRVFKGGVFVDVCSYSLLRSDVR